MKRKIFLACVMTAIFVGGCAQSGSTTKNSTYSHKVKSSDNCSRDEAKDIVVCKNHALGVLTWQDMPNIPIMNWQQAKEYCENLNFADFSDWKLPTRTELMSIIDYDSKAHALNKTFKSFDIKNSRYWSATTRAENFLAAWSVQFDNGNTHWDGVSKTNATRCVRGVN